MKQITQQWLPFVWTKEYSTVKTHIKEDTIFISG